MKFFDKKLFNGKVLKRQYSWGLLRKHLVFSMPVNVPWFENSFPGDRMKPDLDVPHMRTISEMEAEFPYMEEWFYNFCAKHFGEMQSGKELVYYLWEREAAWTPVGPLLLAGMASRSMEQDEFLDFIEGLGLSLDDYKLFIPAKK